MDDDADEWITASEAGRMIGRTERQARRYATSGRVRSMLRGRSVVLHRGDVQALAEALAAEARDAAPRQELVSPGLFLDEIRRLNEQLQAAAAREGYLRAQVEQLQAQIVALRAELDREQRQIAEAARPWWRRLFGHTTGRPDR